MGSSNSKAVGENGVERTRKALEKAEKKYAAATEELRWAEVKYPTHRYDWEQNKTVMAYWRKVGDALDNVISARDAHAAALRDSY